MRGDAKDGIDSLIARSSVGAGLADIRANGIDAHLEKLDEELAPKKRKKATSPTARTLAEARKRGWIAQVVERWNPHARVRQDLFGVIDLIAVSPPIPGHHPRSDHDGDGPCGACARDGAIVGIQATVNRSGQHAAHRAKILAEPRARAWVGAGGRLELWTWAQQGARGKRKLWTLRVETFAVVDGQFVALAQEAA